MAALARRAWQIHRAAAQVARSHTAQTACRCLHQTAAIRGEAQAADDAYADKPYLNSLQTPGVRGNNPRKQFLLKRIDEALLEPKVALVYHGNNVTADEWEDIRFAVTSAGGKARQLRNGVAQARLRGTSFDGLSCLFASTTYVVSTDDIGAIKKLTKLKIPMELLGGKVEERVVTRDEILDIAKLPSLDEMRAQLVGLLSTPASRLVQSLDSHPQELAAALARYSNPPSDDAGDDAGDA